MGYFLKTPSPDFYYNRDLNYLALLYIADYTI